jgi:GTPase SAR1 family protein
MSITAGDPFGYERRAEQRRTLLGLIGELDGIAAALTMTKWNDDLGTIADRVERDTFKILVIGEMKRGKSTLINALLGQKVLPAHTLPKTAIVSEVKWGDVPRAVLHYRTANGSPPRESLEVAVEDLDAYVSIDRKNKDAPSPYAKAEVFWNLELCRHRVEIIDSPGLNEHELRDEATLEYLLEADATVFVVLATQAFSKSETDYLRQRVQPAAEEAFFVFNRINDIDADERDEVCEELAARVADYASAGEPRVFFINARAALDGRQSGDEALVAGSGVPELEAALHRFLTDDRGRAKLMSPLRALDDGVRATRAEIPQKRAYLATSLDDLASRYALAQGPLKDLELRRHNMVATLNNHIAELREDVTASADDFYRTTADAVGAWTEAYTLENRITLNALKVKENAKAACEEIGLHLGGRIQNAFKEWSESEALRTLLSDRLTALRAELDRDSLEFTAQVDAIRSGLVHEEGEPVQAAPDLPSGTERLIAASIGVLLPGSAVSGATLGMDALIKSIIPQLAIAATGIFLLGLTPLGLMALLGASAFAINFGQLEKANEKLKRETAAAVSADLRDNATARAEELGKTAARPLEKMRDVLAGAAAGEIQTIRDQVEAALADKRAGEQQVAERNRELDDLDRRLDRLQGRVDDLRHVVNQS